MKKIIPILLLTLIILCPIFAESADATTVFLTSDNLQGHDADFHRLNEIKNIIESKTNGQITVVIDDSASNPGEGTRLMNAKNCDVGVAIAGACAGNLIELADYSTRTTRKVIYVNAGSLDLNNIKFLRRSYDDNWSNYRFASLQSPGTFLSDAGISLVQPALEYPGDCHKGIIKSDSENINEYIADSIINSVNAGTSANKQLDSNLIVYHKMDPKYLAEDCKLIVDGKGSDMRESYGSYTTQQLLYMSASYIAGYSLQVPQDFEAPENPERNSLFTRWRYSFNDYCNMADIVVDYMNKNGKAPDYIEYEGARIGYYDLLYNFALLCQDDTSASNMNFPSKMIFQRYYSNILLDLIPIVIIGIIFIIFIIGIRKVLKKIRRGKRGGYNQRNRSREINTRQYYDDSRYYPDYDYPSNRPNRKRRRR